MTRIKCVQEETEDGSLQFVAWVLDSEGYMVAETRSSRDGAIAALKKRLWGTR